MPLADTAIKKAKPGSKPVKLADGKGLYLLVNPVGSKLWRCKYRVLGKEKVLSLGAYPDVSLAQAHRAVVRTARFALGRWRGRRERLGLLRHYLGAQPGIRGQHTMKPNQVQTWPWHQRRQPPHELQRRHVQMRGAVAPAA